MRSQTMSAKSQTMSANLGEREREGRKAVGIINVVRCSFSTAIQTTTATVMMIASYLLHTQVTSELA